MVSPVDPSSQRVDVLREESLAASTRISGHKAALIHEENDYIYQKSFELAEAYPGIVLVNPPTYFPPIGGGKGGDRVFDIKHLPGKFINEVNAICSTAVDFESAQDAVNQLATLYVY